MSDSVQSVTLRVTTAPAGEMLPEAVVVETGPITIGRTEGNHLILPDRGALVSRQHCRIEQVGSGWQLVDLSTNGTFVNEQPVGRNSAAQLRPGDTIRMGEWNIVVEAAMMHTAAPSMPATMPPPGSGNIPPPDALDPFGIADLAQLRGGPGGMAPEPPPLPPSTDLFGDLSQPERGRGPPRGKDPWSQGFEPEEQRGPPPVDVHAVSVPAAYIEGAQVGLPDDWNIAPDAAPSARAPAPAAPPAGRAPQRARAPAPAAPIPAEMGAPPSGGGGDDGLLQAFIEGGGFRSLPPDVTPQRAMQALGESMRLLVTTLARLLAARRALKSEFRINQTIVGARENNPLKFSVDETEMLQVLMGSARPGFQTGPAAVADACRDLEAHQLAMLAGLRAALELVFERLSPANIGKREAGGWLNSGKSKLWDLFQQEFADLRRDVSDNLSGDIGAAFTAAYEEEAGRHR